MKVKFASKWVAKNNNFVKMLVKVHGIVLISCGTTSTSLFADSTSICKLERFLQNIFVLLLEKK